MVKVILGHAGAGKTKDIIDLVTKAVEEESGSVICIEKGAGLTYDLPYNVRLIDATEYDFSTVCFFKGFISGLFSGNFDITHIFVDGLNKLIDDNSEKNIEALLDWLNVFSDRNSMRITVSVGMDEDTASEGVRKYL